MYENDFSFVRLFKAYGRIADFRGRSTRTELLGYWVATWVLSNTAMFILIPASQASGRLMPIASILNALILIPAPGLAVRRAHDIGWPGLAALLLILPAAASMIAGQSLDYFPILRTVLNVAYLGGIVMLLWKPQDGDNRYGPDPRLVDDRVGQEP